MNEPKVTWEEKKNGIRRLPFQMEKYLMHPFQVCSFETRDAENESLKSRSAVFKKPIPTSYYYEMNASDGSTDKKKVHQLVSQQRVMVMIPEIQKKEQNDEGLETITTIPG
jgi:hypothetical protein